MMARCHGFIFCIYLQSIFFTYGFLIFPRGWCLRHHETRLHLAAFFLKPFILLDLSAQWATELRLKEIHCQPPWGQRQDHACSGQGDRSILAPQLETIQLHFVDFAHFFDLPIFTCHISDWGESTSSTQAEAMLWNCWKVWELVICLSFPKTCCMPFLFVVHLPYLPLDTDQFDLVPLFAKDPPAADDGSEGNGDAVWWFGVKGG